MEEGERRKEERERERGINTCQMVEGGREDK